MIKTVLLSTFLVAFAIIAIPMTSANACATCGCADKAAHSHAKKPCMKCAEAGKPCKCGKKAKKPCEKTLAKKAKPCEKKLGKKPCDKKMGKKPCEKKLGKKSAKTLPANNKGSLVIQSGQSFKSRASANYN